MSLDFLNDYIVKLVDDALENFEYARQLIEEQMRLNPEESKQYEAIMDNIKNINNHLQMDRFGVVEGRKIFNNEYEPKDIGNSTEKGSIYVDYDGMKATIDSLKAMRKTGIDKLRKKYEKYVKKDI